MRQRLGRKVITGVGWTLASSITVRLLQFLVTVVLARLLAPSAFGLFALCAMIIIAIQMFRDLGFGQALIYHKTDVQKNAETTFVMSGLFGFVAWGVMWIMSPIVAKVFGNAALIWPLRIMSSSVVLSSLATVPSIMLERELEFRKRAMPEFALGISYATVAIILAVKGFGIWSLVWGQVASVFAQSTVTWLVAGWKPAVSFHKSNAARTLNYGKPLMAASVLYLAFFYVDNAAIGKWLGVTALGFYNLAFTICNLPATNITHVVNKVMYPAYSKLNDNMPAMRDAYTKTIKSIALLTFPIAFWIFLASGDMVHGFFGPKWAPTIPLFRVLAFYGLFRSIGATAGSVFMAVGEPKWVYRLNSIQLAVAVPLVYPVAMHYGTFGVATLFTLAYTTGTALALWKVVKILGMTVQEYAGMFRTPILATLITVVPLFLIAKLLLPSGIGVTIGSVLLLAASYPFVAIALDRETYQAARSILKPPTHVYEAVASGNVTSE